MARAPARTLKRATVRQVSSHRPYFAMWVANAEVMERLGR